MPFRVLVKPTCWFYREIALRFASVESVTTYGMLKKKRAHVPKVVLDFQLTYVYSTLVHLQTMHNFQAAERQRLKEHVGLDSLCALVNTSIYPFTI